MAQPTQQELVAICNHFLISSPPGEFNEVVTDIRGLLSDDTILNDTAPATFREYNTEQMLTVQSPNNEHQVLITKHGEVADGEFLDPRGQQVVLYDHIQQTATGARGLQGELDQDVEPFRAAFEEHAFAYTADHYQNGATTVYGSKKGSQYEIIVCISSSKYNSQNFWNGRWRSVWTITFSPSGGQVSMTGLIKVNVHYYEDGNVQLITESTQKSSSTGGDAEATAAAALKAIAKVEQNFQTALEQSYNTMGETTFKALRRALPIFKTKIDWNKISTYKVNKDLGGGKPK
jgi:capping protein alpha